MKALSETIEQRAAELADRILWHTPNTVINDVDELAEALAEILADAMRLREALEPVPREGLQDRREGAMEAHDELMARLGLEDHDADTH